MTKRKKPPFAGSWHLPGSFVLKGEALIDCVKRVAKEELGIKIEIEKQIQKKKVELAGVFDDIDGDPRGHVIDLIYRCEIQKGVSLADAKDTPYLKLKPVGDSAEIRFFQKLPANMGFNHRETLAKLGYR